MLFNCIAGIAGMVTGNKWKNLFIFWLICSNFNSKLNIILIIAFTFFYTAIVFRPEDVSNNLKNNGGTIPAIRPGKPTTEYLSNIMNRLCLLDGLFLAAVASLPTIVGNFTSINMAFGGTSLLIIIGVALDVCTQIRNREQFSAAQNRGFLS